MGQPHRDFDKEYIKNYDQACIEAANKALQAMHVFSEGLALVKSELLQGYEQNLVLTAKVIDKKHKPSAPKSEVSVLTVEDQATSGNLTAFIRMRKLGEVRPVRDEMSKLPFPFNGTIIPPVLAELLADLNADSKKLQLSKENVEQLIGNSNLPDWQKVFSLSDAERKAIYSGKLRSLTFESVIKKRLRKHYMGPLGNGFLALGVWNKAHEANHKWVLHVHDDGQLFAECLETEFFVKLDSL